jgi:hypothetical protein
MATPTTSPPKFAHAKAQCPCCKWFKKSFLLPAHIVEHHPCDIIFSKVPRDHCIAGYVLKGKTDHWFACCLTCKKGMMTDGTDKNGARWLSLHSQKDDCKKSHKSAFNVFLQIRNELREITPGPGPIPEPVKVTPISDFWQSLKKHPRLRMLTEQIEQSCKAEFEDDSDNEGEFAFNPSEGLKNIACLCVGNKKYIDELNKRINEVEQEYNSFQTEHNIEMSRANNRIDYLCKEVVDKCNELQTLRNRMNEMEARIKQLEKTNGLYLEKYPDLEENPE